MRVIGRTGINHFQSSLHFSFCTLYIPLSLGLPIDGGVNDLGHIVMGGPPINLANCKYTFQQNFDDRKIGKISHLYPISLALSFCLSLFSYFLPLCFPLYKDDDSDIGPYATSLSDLDPRLHLLKERLQKKRELIKHLDKMMRSFSGDTACSE